MKRTLWATLLLLAAAGHAFATPITVYQNTNGLLFRSTTNPNRALDDGFFPAGTTASDPFLVTAVNLGYAIVGAGPAAVEIRVTFYDTLNANAGAGQPVNTGPLGSFSIFVEHAGPDIYSTGLYDITHLPGGGIEFPDDDWAIDVEFFDPNSEMRSTRATVAFASGTPLGGPAVGASQDRFWRDVNGNNIYEAAELRTFPPASPPNLANFFLTMQGVVIPEPCTLLLLGAGALLAARRRR